MKIKSVECFQVNWPSRPGSTPVSAWVKITDGDGCEGVGEASPMLDGLSSLQMIANHLADDLVGANPFDISILHQTLFHKLVKLGPDGAAAAALAAIDIALWDLKGKRLGLPVFQLLGGAWRRKVPFYTSVGHTANLQPEEVATRVLERLAAEKTNMVKLRISRSRLTRDFDIAGDIAKAVALRKAVGDDINLAFDGNNGYSVGGAIRVGRALEELGFVWFEEPLQHYDECSLSNLTRRLDISVATGEQTYTLQGFVRLIDAGVTILQPDVVKMGGISGVADVMTLARAHGVDVAQHQTQPTLGQTACLHLAAAQFHGWAPLEFNDASNHQAQVFRHVPEPIDGHFEVSERPGLGIVLDEAKLAPMKALVTRN